MTTIIYLKGGCRKIVAYLMPKDEALKAFKKEYGNCKILFTYN